MQIQSLFIHLHAFPNLSKPSSVNVKLSPGCSFPQKWLHCSTKYLWCHWRGGIFEFEWELYLNLSIFPHTKLSCGVRRLDSNPSTGIIPKRAPGQDKTSPFVLHGWKNVKYRWRNMSSMADLANQCHQKSDKTLPHTFVTLLIGLCEKRAHCLEQAGMKWDIGCHAYFFFWWR